MMVSIFMPCGDFWMHLGYKLHVTPQMEGDLEEYPTTFVMRRGPKNSVLKGYAGRTGGHAVFMFHGFLTNLLNWTVLSVVLSQVPPQETKEYYALVGMQVLTTVFGLSMLLNSLMGTFSGKSEGGKQHGQQGFTGQKAEKVE